MPNVNEFGDSPLVQQKPETNEFGDSAASASKATSAPLPVGGWRTGLDQSLQGATFGFGDEATDRIGAGIAHAVTGEPYSNLLNEARQSTKDRLKQEFVQHPAISIGSNVAGALLTGGAGATTKIGSAVGDFLGAGGTALRVAKGLGAGAASGALYGAGTADDGNALQGAEHGAISGAMVGGAVPVVGAVASGVKNTAGDALTGLYARLPEAAQDIGSSMKSSAGDLYNQMRQVGATFNPQATKSIVSNIGSALSSVKFIPGLNPKTSAIVDDIKSAAQNGTLGLDDLDQYRRLLGRVGGSEDGVSAGNVKNAIDNFVNNAGQKDLATGSTQAIDLLNQGRKQYQQASKFQDVADVLTKADGDPNKIKSGLTRFLQNDNNTRGWSQDEVQSLKEAASSTGTEKILKMVGKFGFDLGTSTTSGNTVAPLLGKAIIGGGIGTAAAGATGAVAVPAVGTAARYAQTLAARGKAENLLRTLEGANLPQAAAASINPVIYAPAAAGASTIPSNQGLTFSQALQMAKSMPPAIAKQFLSQKQ